MSFYIKIAIFLLFFTFVSAKLMSPTEYADYLAKTIDDTVRNIHATYPNSKITHADVLTILCLEQQSLNIGNSSHKGAQGLTQVMPQTFNEYVRKNIGGLGDFVRMTGCTDKHLSSDVRCSIEAGARIFNYYLIKYNGDRTKAAIAYNGGPSRVNLTKIPKETYEYAFLKLPACMQPIINGRTPVGTVIWQRLTEKVREFSSNFNLQGVSSVPYTAGLQPFSSFRADAANYSFWDKLKYNLGFSPYRGLYNLPTSYNIPREYSFPDKYLLPNSNSLNSSFNTKNDTNYEFAQQDLNSNLDILDSNTLFSEIKYTDADDSNIHKQTIKYDNNADLPTKASILCEPKMARRGSPVLIRYYCPEDYNFSPINFVASKNYGIVIEYPEQSTDYKIKCSDKTSRNEYIYSCNIQVFDPKINLTANLVDTSNKYAIEWNTEDVSSCTLFVNDKKISQDLNGRKVVRNNRKINVKLVCESQDGLLIKDELRL